ncbi:hypothetical protein BGZ76_002701 [Entomortierella beljakovae]|nr:hypothetical protein BGZ76_002701 [Entomortierella beljakovae]
MSINQSTASRKPPLRTLQPRSAAAIDFNDSDDDEGPLSSDYRQQRNTTKDLVDFFKNTHPPPPPAPTLPPLAPEEKKKKGILHRLRSRKTNLSLGRDGPSRANSVAPSFGGTASSVSANSRGEVATLPNGKKYIMIAIDYKSGNGDLLANGGSTASRAPLIVSPNKRLSMIKNIDNSGSKRASLLSNNPNFQVTTTIQEDNMVTSNNEPSKRSSHATDKRRSIIIHAGGGEGSSFTLDDTPFLLDNFALDTEFINTPAGSEQIQAQPISNTQPSSGPGEANGMRSPTPRQGSETSSKRTTRVTFNIAGQENEPMSEEAVSNALVERIANHKAQLFNGTLPQASNTDLTPQETKVPEVILPKPVTRKKVRHVQIQTQHCIMRPMHTQTEPLDSINSDSEPKEFSCQTEGSIDGSTDVGTCTDSEITAVSSKVRRTSKVASYVASFNQPGLSAATLKGSATVSKGNSTAEFGSTTLNSHEHEELIQLRQQNLALQAQVATLQRELSAETRARTRTIVAMQDTRDKFEALSSLAYKKMKEMITNRHILEMEVRELRAQTDMQNDEDEMYNQQGYVNMGVNY